MILLAKKSVSERKMSGGAAAGNYILTEVKYILIFTPTLIYPFDMTE